MAAYQSTDELKLEKQRSYARRWREKNRDRLLQYFRKYRADHPELKQYHATYYLSVSKSSRKPLTPDQKLLTKQRKERTCDRIRKKDRDWRLRRRERMKGIDGRPGSWRREMERKRR